MENMIRVYMHDQVERWRTYTERTRNNKITENANSENHILD